MTSVVRLSISSLRIMADKIVVVDDDDNSRETMAIILEDVGFDVELIEGEDLNKEKLVSDIVKMNCYGIVSDHRLSPGKMAQFTGAELLSLLYDHKVPPVLVTQFLDMDADVSIRKYRDKLPAVLAREDQTGDNILRLLEMSRRELEYGYPVTRKPYRAIIRIEDYNVEDQVEVVDGIITNWRTDTAVRFPGSLIPEEIWLKIKSDPSRNRLVAFVNTGADHSKDIYINGIQLAPDLEDDDGLA